MAKMIHFRTIIIMMTGLNQTLSEQTPDELGAMANAQVGSVEYMTQS